MSSLGFCGGWFIWFRWLLVVIVPGGGCRVPRWLRARRGVRIPMAECGREVPVPVDPLGGGEHGRRRCPPKGPGYGSARPCTRSLSASARAKPKGIPLRASRGDRLGLGQGLPVADGPVLHPTVVSGAPGPSGQYRLVSAARRPSEGRPGPGRCTGRWRFASPRFAARRHR